MIVGYVYIVMHDDCREYDKNRLGIPLACFNEPEAAIKYLLMTCFGEADSLGYHWRGIDRAWIEEQPVYDEWKDEFIREWTGSVTGNV